MIAPSADSEDGEQLSNHDISIKRRESHESRKVSIFNASRLIPTYKNREKLRIIIDTPQVKMMKTFEIAITESCKKVFDSVLAKFKKQKKFCCILECIEPE